MEINETHTKISSIIFPDWEHFADGPFGDMWLRNGKEERLFNLLKEDDDGIPSMSAKSDAMDVKDLLLGDIAMRKDKGFGYSFFKWNYEWDRFDLWYSDSSNNPCKAIFNAADKAVAELYESL